MKLFNFMTRLSEFNNKRRTLNRLRALPDYLLRDVGITRESLYADAPARTWQTLDDNYPNLPVAQEHCLRFKMERQLNDNVSYDALSDNTPKKSARSAA